MFLLIYKNYYYYKLCLFLLSGHEVYTQFFAATHEYDSAPRGTLLFVYGGPNVQMVQDAYNAQRYALVRLLTLCGFNVVSIDGRGSSHRGSDFEGALKHAMVGYFGMIILCYCVN